MSNPMDGAEVIFSTLAGSHMYGTNTQESDIDERKIFIPNLEYLFGIKRVEQIISHGEDKDEESYDIRKFFNLAKNNNPTILEYFFIKPENLIYFSPTWEIIMEKRNLFLSKKIKDSFSGYAYSQLKRIMNHRAWVLNKPTKKPERKDFGLPTQKLVSEEKLAAFRVIITKSISEIGREIDFKKEIEKIENEFSYESLFNAIKGIDEIEEVREILKNIFRLLNNDLKRISNNYPNSKEELDKIIEKNSVENIMENFNEIGLMKKALSTISEFSDELILILSKERSYQSAMRNWDSYNVWKNNRNPKRAELEEKYGYDTKHASHLYRLLTEGEELLKDGIITLPRPDKDFLLEIKHGKLSYDELIEITNKRFDILREIYKNSLLPETVNNKEIDNLLFEILKNKI